MAGAATFGELKHMTCIFLDQSNRDNYLKKPSLIVRWYNGKMLSHNAARLDPSNFQPLFFLIPMTYAYVINLVSLFEQKKITS